MSGVQDVRSTPIVPAAPAPGELPEAASMARRVVQAARNSLTGVLGGLVGLVPHVLHHITLLAGTAFVAGSGGTVLFGVVGLVASVPTLWRLRRRFGTSRAPAIGLAAFAAMFAVSTFVIGPQISGQSDAPDAPVEQHDDHAG